METLARHFRELTKAAFARHGFAYGELLAQWSEVAGAEMAQYCQPERLRWPRGQEDTQRKMGGILTLRVLPGRALDIQYATPQVIERINGFYGYAAVADIKIVQGQLSPSVRQRPDAVLRPEHSITGADLESALSRLGAAVKTKHATPSPAEDDASAYSQSPDPQLKDKAI